MLVSIAFNDDLLRKLRKEKKILFQEITTGVQNCGTVFSLFLAGDPDVDLNCGNVHLVLGSSPHL